MIRYLTHENIDKQRWDECVQNAPNGLIFGNSWLLDIAHPGWAGVVYRNYEAVLMVPLKKKLLLHYALQPFFIRHAGIYSRKELAQEEIREMMDAIPSAIRWVKLFTYPVKEWSGSSWTVSARRFQRVDLSPAYETLYSGLSTNTKRNLKKAEKQELRIDSCTPAVVIDLFRRYKGAELEVFSEKHYTVLRNMMDACTQRDCGEAYAVSDAQGNILAAGFFCRFRDTLTFLKGAVSGEGKTTGAMHFLFCRVMEKYAGKISVLDFGGSNVESVARFYKSFGGQDQEYVQIERNRLPGLIRMIKK